MVFGRWEKAFVVGKDRQIEGGIPIFEDITKLSVTRKENKMILSYEFEEKTKIDDNFRECQLGEF